MRLGLKRWLNGHGARACCMYMVATAFCINLRASLSYSALNHGLGAGTVTERAGRCHEGRRKVERKGTRRQGGQHHRCRASTRTSTSDLRELRAAIVLLRCEEVSVRTRRGARSSSRCAGYSLAACQVSSTRPWAIHNGDYSQWGGGAGSGW